MGKYDAYYAEYRKNNKGKIDAYAAEYYQRNKEERKAYSRDWGRDNPGLVRAKAARRKSRKLNQMPEDANQEWIKLIYMHSPDGYEVDHIIPLSKGGLHHEQNLQYLTVEDNRTKGAKL